MNGWRFFYIATFHLLLPNALAAQKSVSEGVIRYAVTMDKPDNNTSTKGTYTIYLKNNYVRKELKMDNGFEFVMILEGREKGYLLKRTPNKNYAVVLDMNQRSSKYERYRYYELKTTDHKKEIAGYTTQAAAIHYKDGTKTDVYLARDLRLTNEFVFDRFPAIEFLPLEYIVKNDAGMTMYFTAEKVTLKPLDNGYFRVPEGHVLINKEEAPATDK